MLLEWTQTQYAPVFRPYVSQVRERARCSYFDLFLGKLPACARAQIDKVYVEKTLGEPETEEKHLPNKENISRSTELQLEDTS